VINLSNGEKPGEFLLESFFPASRASSKLFDNYSTEGEFNPYIPENPRLNGLLSPAIPLFSDVRISLNYSLYNGSFDNEVKIGYRYRFVSRAETKPSGEKFIRQTLSLTASPKQAEGGFIELQFFDRSEVKPLEIGRPVYRHILVRAYDDERDESTGYANYLLKNSEGVYSPTDFADGSDRTLPEFKGGSLGLFIFQVKYMEYPPKALAERLSETILVTATITEKGAVKDVEIMSGSDPDLRKEALRLVKKTSGKWIPATHNGKNIPDFKVIPINFNPEYAPQW
jgi:TonB family protein